MPGAVIYRGPSLIDGAPIVVVAVWGSTNRKTGDMLQTYILREDIDPLTANKLGEDYSICGDCALRGTPTLDPDKKQAEERPCYVVLGQGPTVVWKGLQRGIYPDRTTKEERIRIGRDRMVRIGTYGDGAATPTWVWTDLIREAQGHTAYTHNRAPSTLFMRSADTLEQAQAAWQSNVRTFRVIHHITQLQPKQEILCPSDRGVQCVDCGLCAGSSIKAKSIAIVVHGPGAKHF